MSLEKYEYRRGAEEMEKTETLPEASEAIKATFVRRPEIVILGCGDDRPLTPQSAAVLRETGAPLETAFMRLFGGKYGAARVLLVAVTAQHGRAAGRELSGDGFFGLADEVAARAAPLGVIMVSHSAIGAEQNPDHLNSVAEDDIACAYGAGIGLISEMNAVDQLSIRVAENESARAFRRTPRRATFDQLARANHQSGLIAFGPNPRNFKIRRADLLSSGTPVMILDGQHAATEEASHVLNFTTDRISDVNEAIARGLYYYDNDIVQVAETLIKAYPELNLDPEILLNTMILDAAATRAALAASDGGLADPRRIDTVRIGDADEAYDYLSSL